jgi:hypothetical protein
MRRRGASPSWSFPEEPNMPRASLPLPSVLPLRRRPGMRAARHAAGAARAWGRARSLILAGAVLLVWAALAAWAAGVPPGAPFQPAQRLRSVGADFQVVAGAAAPAGRQLAITAAGAEHTAAQALALSGGIAAADFPVLRYRWHAFPRTHELSFMFRRADAPGDVQTLTLPPAGAYPAYFDLSSVPAWHGRIVEIGFAEYPTAQLVPADMPLRPFALVEAELWSASWRGSLGALGTDWLAYRPWALMSVSALGPDAPWPHKASPVVVLALGLAGSLLVAGAVLRRGRRWFAAAACIALAAGWIVLDLRWLADLSGRHALTRELYAGKPWRERAAIEPDSDLVAAAARVRAVLAQEPAARHLVVAADSPYAMLRLGYHLLPANSAPATAWMRTAAEPAPQTLLVVYAAPDWRFDARRGVLQGPVRAFAARALLDDGDLRVFRLLGAAR